MAQSKAIFIGRLTEDAGIEAYRRLALRANIKLDEYTNVPDAAKFLPDYNFAFVSRYLAILEALAVGIPVVAHYNNRIKYDYLAMAPFAKFITVFKDPDKVSLRINQKLIIQGQEWVIKQTWTKLANIYEKLWQR